MRVIIVQPYHYWHHWWCPRHMLAIVLTLAGIALVVSAIRDICGRGFK
jgi:hypothetical protein